MVAVVKQEPNSLAPQEGHVEQPDRELLVTADHKRSLQKESDPSLLVQTGDKRRRLMVVASPSETRNIIQKVEDLAELLLCESDATGHEDHNFQTDGVSTSELETFHTLMSKLKGRLETQQNTLGNVSVPLASRAEYSEVSFRPSSPAYAPTSPEYDPFRDPLSSRAEDSEGSFRPSSPAYAPKSPEYDPFRK